MMNKKDIDFFLFISEKGCKNAKFIQELLDLKNKNKLS